MSARSLVTVFCDLCGDWDGAGIGDTAREARNALRGPDSPWMLDVPDPDGGRVRRDYCCREHAEQAGGATP